MNIIIPKILVDPETYKGRPLFFLAGPLRGAGDWQKPMAELLEREVPDAVIAIPQRYDSSHPLHRLVMEGQKDAFSRQLAWEEHYLQTASTSGGVIFWLGTQKEPRDDDEPYAMDTRREIGEWPIRAKYEPGVKLFIGAEPGFYGLDQIERSLHRVLGDSFIIHSSMESLVQAAALRP